ncbi:MAG: hypothetical protein QOH72_4596 [Solirubrobacteraceae bacterium]|jgi:hypothetical protein|nr:hypothetical protein [Solirubrobacteraceae bacterium]
MARTTGVPTRRQAAARCAIAALSAAAGVALLVLAAVAPSPGIVVLLAACAVTAGALIAGPLPVAVLVLRLHRRPRRRLPITPRARRALAQFHRELDALPETPHPIGL